MTGLGFSPGAIGPLGFWYLTLFGGLIPWAAIRTKRRIAARPLPPKKRYFVSVIIQQLIFLAVTLVTAYVLGIEVFRRYRPTVAHLGLSLVMLGAAVAVLRPKWRDQVTRRARRIYLVTPVDRTDHLLWLVISICAGVGEELTYRGVMFWLTVWLTSSIPVAVVFCTVSFAVGHAAQGWRSAAAIGIFALGFHGLVLVTGSLYPAMAVHALYDIIAGFSYGRFGRDTGYPIEPMPPREPNDWPVRTPG